LDDFPIKAKLASLFSGLNITDMLCHVTKVIETINQGFSTRVIRKQPKTDIAEKIILKRPLKAMPSWFHL